MTGRLPHRLLLGCTVPLLIRAGSAARRHRVDIRDLAYQPRNLVVGVGDTVSWLNDDIVPHTVTFDDATGDRDEILPGERFMRVISERGALHYRCRYHPGMAGTVVVGEQ